MNREERSWVLYDAANSAFVLVLVTAIMPLYFKQVASGAMSGADSTAVWGYANSFVSFLLAFAAPFLGAIADVKMWKKMFFTIFLFIGISSTLGLALLPGYHWAVLIALYVPARLGWGGANVFYDAFLVDIARGPRMDTLSARGYGWGYLGSVVPFLAVIGLLTAAGLEDGLDAGATRLGFGLVAVWWLGLSVPGLRHLVQRDSQDSGGGEQFLGIRHTFRALQANRPLRMFLLAYFFYIDGVNTIITMATVYAKDLGFGAGLMIAVLLLIQLVAFPCTLLVGKLCNRFSTRLLILAGIGCYGLITILAFSLPFFTSPNGKQAVFWLIAILVASAMGGIQALSRSYFGQMVPPARSAEYFGVFNMVGKFAAIGGPLLMAAVTQSTGDSRWGVLSLLVLFGLGAIFLVQSPELNKKNQAD